MLIPLEVGSPQGEDLTDVLLLYDSSNESVFDSLFCQIAEYYGLLCRKAALDTVEVTAELLQDEQSSYFKLVGISADTLLRSPSQSVRHGPVNPDEAMLRVENRDKVWDGIEGPFPLLFRRNYSCVLLLPLSDVTNHSA